MQQQPCAAVELLLAVTVVSVMHRFLLALACAAACAAPAAAAAAPAATAVVTTPQVRAELVAHAPQGVAAGQPLWLGLRIEHAPHWHTYWKNAGDSGLPTTLAWNLPPGVTAGDIHWPTPQRLPIGPLVNYGYEGTLLLPVPLAVPASFAADSLRVQLRADWLVCKTECIPESGEFALDVPARAATVAHAALFEATRAAAPAVPPGAEVAASIEGDRLVLRAQGLPATLSGKRAELFPEVAGVIENAAPVEQGWQGDAWQARVALAAQRSASPDRLPVVLRFDGEPRGVLLTAAVAGPWPAAAPTAPVSPALQAAIAEGRAARDAALPAPAAIGLPLALLFALVGGAILNLMPCVFPVLSLKVLGFSQHAHEARERVTGGAAYTAGVVLSFVALAALLLALRAAGEQLGWGFQLQSPGFIAALAVLFTVIGLNLAGVFEFGTWLPSGAAALRARHPAVDAFLTGVLAVAVASPCTAPFMGASLGLALTLPAAQAIGVFAMLGLGMALPYLLLTLVPAATRWLPRPGAWMQRFKVMMSFAMFATVVWLVWVLGSQVGIDGAAALLALLVALAFAVWAFGSLRGAGRTATGAGRIATGAGALLLAGATLAWAVPQWQGSAGRATTPIAADARWQPWSADRVRELNAQGRTVFVDFTAAWCVTCQFNKRTTLADEALLAAFEAKRVVLMRADWTSRDAAITRELARLQRSGVPVYVFYRGGQAAPLVLSELLTVSEVRSAMSSL
jgi:thiol:disulfide interchange protein